MPTLEKDRFSSAYPALVVFWLFALIVLIGTNYEMIAIFVDALYDKASTINDEMIKSGVASY